MALNGDQTLRLKGLDTYQSYLVAAGAVIHLHALVATDPNSGGYLVPASDTAGLHVVGLATHAVDNRGGQDGDIHCRVYKGAARIPTTGANALAQVDVGARAYVLDDEYLVAAAGTTNQINAGEVLEIEPGFAWVRLGA